MAKEKLNPKSLLKKSLKNNNLSNISLTDLDLTNVNFSINDLKNNGDNSYNYFVLKKILDSSSVCQVSDAFFKVSGRNGVIKGLKSINNHKVYGQIVTAKTNSDDWGTSLLAMDEANDGEVLFLYTYGDSSSVWGELASTCAMEKGIAGTILYGYARDIDAVLYLDFPVFALDVVPNAGKALGLGTVHADLEIDDNIIKSGDFVFADESGVVLIPQQLFVSTIIETFNIKIKESKIIDELKKGKSLSEVIGLR